MKKILVLTLILLTTVLGVSNAETVSLTCDADTWVRDGSSSNYGDDESMYILGYAGRVGYIRFDLSSLGAIEIESATLTFTRAETPWGRGDTISTGRFAMVGLNDLEGNTAQDWDELTLSDSNVGAELVGGGFTDPFDQSLVTNLDADDITGVTETITDGGSTGGTVVVTGDALVDFLQGQVYDGGLATVMVACEQSTYRGFWIATKENSESTYAPKLEITYSLLTKASNPSPADGASVSDSLAKLSWVNPTDPNDPNFVITSDVYFGTTVPDANVTNYGLTLAYDDTELTTVDVPETLQQSTTYYWIVDTTDSNSVSSGDVWSFFVSGAPEIVTGPAKTAVFETETATLTAVFTSDNEITDGWPKWYTYEDPNSYEVDDSDADVTISLDYDSETGEFTSTLEIENIEEGDEGLYFCEIDSSAGTTTTETAKILVKRLLAHWPFDGDATDSLGNYDGTETGSPVYDTGMVNNAIVFDGEDDLITLPSGFDDFSAGLTIAVWVNPTVKNNWARIIDFGTGDGADDIFLARDGTTNTLIIDFNPSQGAVEAEDTFEQNVWQMLVVTIDEDGNVVMYKDGLEIQTGTVAAPPTIVERTSNYIGESNWTTDALYEGMMDDLHIYNYGISADKVAGMYSDVYGNYCRVSPALDLTGDCIVNLEDLEELVDLWLDCGLYPNPDCE